MEKIIEISFDKDTWQFFFEVDILFLLSIALIILLIYMGLKIYRSKLRNQLVKKDIVPMELNFEFAGVSTKYEIVRNYATIEIAHRIFIELITRKAALEIDEDDDVIVETYNSWYNLYKITRDELKHLTGDLLCSNQITSDLIKLATDILNIGLRPHLTRYQAKFRKWFAERLKEEENILVENRKSPQQIQKEYPEYSQLIHSMKEVNRLLIDYSKQLRKFINIK